MFHSLQVFTVGVETTEILFSVRNWYLNLAVCKQRTIGPCLKKYAFSSTMNQNRAFRLEKIGKYS